MGKKRSHQTAPSTKTARMAISPRVHTYTCPVHHTDVEPASPPCVRHAHLHIAFSLLSRAPCSRALTHKTHRSSIRCAKDKSRQFGPRWVPLWFGQPAVSLALSLSLVHLLRSILSQWQTFASLVPQREASDCAPPMVWHQDSNGVNYQLLVTD